MKQSPGQVRVRSGSHIKKYLIQVIGRISEQGKISKNAGFGTADKLIPYEIIKSKLNVLQKNFAEWGVSKFLDS